MGYFKNIKIKQLETEIRKTEREVAYLEKNEKKAKWIFRIIKILLKFTPVPGFLLWGKKPSLKKSIKKLSKLKKKLDKLK